MGLFKKLGSLFSPPSKDSRSLWIYVKCDKCGEILKGRVDLHNDLSVDYDESSGGTLYFCRKVFVGSNRCYRPIELQLTFDKNKRLMNQEVSGGEIVDEKDYLAANPEAEI